MKNKYKKHIIDSVPTAEDKKKQKQAEKLYPYSLMNARIWEIVKDSNLVSDYILKHHTDDELDLYVMCCVLFQKELNDGEKAIVADMDPDDKIHRRCRVKDGHLKPVAQNLLNIVEVVFAEFLATGRIDSQDMRLDSYIPKRKSGNTAEEADDMKPEDKMLLSELIEKHGGDRIAAIEEFHIRNADEKDFKEGGLDSAKELLKIELTKKAEKALDPLKLMWTSDDPEDPGILEHMKRVLNIDEIVKTSYDEFTQCFQEENGYDLHLCADFKEEFGYGLDQIKALFSENSDIEKLVREKVT